MSSPSSPVNATGNTPIHATVQAQPAVPPHIARYLGAPVDEDRQFDFLIGDWAVQATRFNADGAAPTHYTATWRAQPLAGGRVLMDEFTALAPDARPVSCFITLRTYSTDTRRWEMTGLAALQPAGAMQWHGHHAGGEMHLTATGTDPAGRAVHTRIRFSEITPQRFVWTSESSLDAGLSWTCTATLVATRAGGHCSAAMR